MLIIFERKKYVGYLTLNRPEVFNAIHTALLLELDKHLETIEQSDLHCLVVTGAGAAFAAGEDINEMKNMTKAEAQAYSNLGRRVLRRLENLHIPTIAAVNGWALGGGCELAMACDIRIAAETAIFSLPETGLGITTGFDGTRRLTRIVGEGKAKEMIFSGKRIRGPEALQFSMVSQIHPAQYLMEEVSIEAEKIARFAPRAIQFSKQLFQAAATMDSEQSGQLESVLFSQCFEEKEQQEAMRDFLAR